MVTGPLRQKPGSSNVSTTFGLAKPGLIRPHGGRSSSMETENLQLGFCTPSRRTSRGFFLTIIGMSSPSPRFFYHLYSDVFFLLSLLHTDVTLHTHAFFSSHWTQFLLALVFFLISSDVISARYPLFLLFISSYATSFWLDACWNASLSWSFFLSLSSSCISP